MTLPAWFRQPGEKWADWDRRHRALNEAEARELQLNYRPPTAYGPSIDLACGVGNYDCNGNPKGSGWW